MKRWSTLLIIREMQIDMTMRCHLPHQSEWPSSQNLQTINAGEGVEKRGHSCTVGGNVSWYSHYGEQYGDSLKKTRTKTTIRPSNPTTEHILWENNNWKSICTPMFIVALLTVARTWKQPKCLSTAEWIKKLWDIYTMEYCSAIKRDTFESVLVRWLNLEPVTRGEVSQKEKTKYILIYMHMESGKMVLMSLFAWQE